MLTSETSTRSFVTNSLFALESRIKRRNFSCSKNKLTANGGSSSLAPFPTPVRLASLPTLSAFMCVCMYVCACVRMYMRQLADAVHECACVCMYACVLERMHGKLAVASSTINHTRDTHMHIYIYRHTNAYTRDTQMHIHETHRCIYTRHTNAYTRDTQMHIHETHKCIYTRHTNAYTRDTHMHILKTNKCIYTRHTNAYTRDTQMHIHETDNAKTNPSQWLFKRFTCFSQGLQKHN
jgi:hypothetical protein